MPRTFKQARMDRLDKAYWQYKMAVVRHKIPVVLDFVGHDMTLYQMLKRNKACRKVARRYLRLRTNGIKRELKSFMATLPPWSINDLTFGVL